jgi:hypothetical protein
MRLKKRKGGARLHPNFVARELLPERDPKSTPKPEDPGVTRRKPTHPAPIPSLVTTRNREANNTAKTPLTLQNARSPPQAPNPLKRRGPRQSSIGSKVTGKTRNLDRASHLRDPHHCSSAGLRSLSRLESKTRT